MSVLANYRFILIYAAALLVFALLVEPEVDFDYLRIAACSGFVTTVFAVFEVGVRYQRLPEEKRRRRYRAAVVWCMGAGYLLSTGAVAVAVLEHFGQPATGYGLTLAASLILSGFWLAALLDEEHGLES